MQKEFEIGQKVFIRRVQYVVRGINQNERIEEWEISRIGRKYIYAKKENSSIEVAFYESKGKWLEKTDYGISYVLYKSKQEIQDEMEREILIRNISSFFQNYFLKEELSLEQLRKIKEIIDEVRRLKNDRDSSR